jgi:arylsulfatase A-like enzyme
MNETQLIFFGPKKEPEELYDLANDPHEIHNLANDPKFKKQLLRHRRLLDNWIKETGDPGLLAVLKRWGVKCVNPEYDRVRHLLEAKKKE